ncbi:MAG: GYD domain-containing protein, partial [Tepidisphaeraceae bacterium]
SALTSESSRASISRRWFRILNRRSLMAQYVMLLNWTDQGVKAAKDTIKRAAAARQAFEKAGARIRELVWTMGPYDAVAWAEAPNDETISAIGLQLGALGNVRSCTLRAYDEREMEQIIKKI